MDKAGLLKAITRLDIAYTGREISGWLSCHCPLAPWKFEHPNGVDRNPGFGIKIEEDGVSHFSCFTCKSKGTIGGLAMQLGRYREEPELIQYGKELDQQDILGTGTDLEWEDGRSDKVKKKLRNTNFPSEREHEEKFQPVAAHPVALEYLRRRGITVVTAHALGLRYDSRQRRILFPVYDYWTGRFAGCSGRSILSARELDTVEQRTGRSQPKVRDYFGLQKDRLLLAGRGAFGRNRQFRRAQRKFSVSDASYAQSEYVLVVEGLFAFAHFTAMGYGPSTVALLGSELLSGKVDILADIGRPIVWFTDNDIAGQSCLYGRIETETGEHNGRGALHAMRHNVAQFVPTYPDWTDDPDDLTRDDVERMIAEAELYAG